MINILKKILLGSKIKSSTYNPKTPSQSVVNCLIIIGLVIVFSPFLVIALNTLSHETAFFMFASFVCLPTVVFLA